MKATNSKYALKIICLIAFLFVFLFPEAQEKESNSIYKFSTEQGLSNNIIYSVLQDRKGFIWIASEEGLNRYDGRNFTHFTFDKGRYKLTHNRTQALLLAPDDNVWIGTSDGLNIYDYRADSIIRVRTNTFPLKLVYNDITCFTNGIDKNITWMGTYGNGINFFDWKQNKFSQLVLPNIKHIEAPLNVMTLLEDDNRRLWIGTRYNGLYRYNIQEKKLEYCNVPGMGVFIRSLFQDSFHRIWVGTSNGCFIYNETTNKLDLVSYPNELINNSIGSITEDKNERIWIGTELNVLNFSVRSFSMLQPFVYRAINYGISSNKLNCPSVNTLFADRDNNMWIGTAWGGVNMLRGLPDKFRLYKHEIEISNSLPNSPITAIYPDKDNLYIATMGTDKVGLGIFNLKTENFSTLPADNKLKKFIYQAILKDSQGNLWLGTYNKGLIKIDKNGNHIQHFYSNINNKNSLPDNDIRCILQTDDKALWFGTSNGIARYNNLTNKVTCLPIFKSRTSVRCMKEDDSGYLWLGTYGEGLMLYQPQNSTLNRNPIGISLGVVTDILIHKDSIWIATNNNGIILYVKKGKHRRIFNTQKGLINNSIKSLVRDKAGRIWFATSQGISNLNPSTGETENYSSQDGVQSSELYERAVAITQSGKIIFGGFGGLNVFDPISVTKNDKCPSVVFTKLQVFNETIYPTTSKYGSGELIENIALAEEIKLKHNQSVFTIEFAGINFNSSQKIQYEYILQGSDEKWNEIGNQNSVTFRNLSPGTYLFKVKASSPDLVWSDSNIAAIRIVILPPFTKTIWAYLLYIVIVASIIYFVWQFITIRIRANNSLKIERAKREKDEELHQEKIQFFTNISHEFRTPVTLIVSPLEKMYADETSEDKKQYLQLVLRNAKRLQNMVNQLLDFRKAERGQMKLKVQQTDMVSVCNDIFNSFDGVRKDKIISFEFICQKNELIAWFDVEFLHKSLSNLLSNAYKFTPKGGIIKVILSEEIDELGHRLAKIKVIDNGKGVLKEDLQYIFNRFYQGKGQGGQNGSGIGLHLTRSLIELHHGTIAVESQPNQKTTFTIMLPIEQSSYHMDEFIEDFDSHNEQSVFFDNLDNSADNKHPRHIQHGFKRILVVDDNEDIRIYIKKILGVEYNVEDAENGLIGLEMANKYDYDLIISDVMMPEVDGLEMCKKLKESIETNHIPIILLTAKSEIENRIEGLSIGAESYITKPFHPKHLIIRVEKLIQLRELLKERYSKKISLGDLNDTKTFTSPDEIFMHKAVKIILERMMESEFNGDLLAAELGISRMGLHRKIKALTGQSTGEFIRNIRLKKAYELLGNKDKNVSEVCYEVGFNSPSYFSTCFTEIYNMTPSEYVKQNR